MFNQPMMDLTYKGKSRKTLLGNFRFTLMIVLSLGFALPATAFAEEVVASKYRKVPIKLPQTYREALGTRTYGPGNFDGAGYGFGCDRGEVVKTCDANTSSNMPKGTVWLSGKLVLGPAINTALFGIKRKTECTASLAIDRSGLSGCVYESCLGYKKTVVMVCVPKGSKS